MIRLVHGNRLTSSTSLLLPLLRKLARYLTFLSLSSRMMPSKFSKKSQQSSAKSPSLKICCKNLLFIDFSSDMFLRYRLLHLEKETLSVLSQSSMCLFLGSYRINLKALRMQYFTNSYLVFFSLPNLSMRVSTSEVDALRGKRLCSASESSIFGQFEKETRQLIICLRSRMLTLAQLPGYAVPRPRDIGWGCVRRAGLQQGLKSLTLVVGRRG